MIRQYLKNSFKQSYLKFLFLAKYFLNKNISLIPSFHKVIQNLLMIMKHIEQNWNSVEEVKKIDEVVTEIEV